MLSPVIGRKISPAQYQLRRRRGIIRYFFRQKRINRAVFRQTTHSSRVYSSFFRERSLKIKLYGYNIFALFQIIKVYIYIVKY